MAYLERRFHTVMAGKQVDRMHTVFLGNKVNRCTWKAPPTCVRGWKAEWHAKHLHGHDPCGCRPGKVQQHQAKLRALFESSEHMFWTVDKEIKLTSFNRGYGDMIERLHGKRPEINLDPISQVPCSPPVGVPRFLGTEVCHRLRGKPMRFETDLPDQQGSVCATRSS
jgi:hypothetical protein